MVIKSLLALAVGGYAAWQLAARRQDQQARARALAEGRKPRAETNWENEGGALRGTGPQLGPAPTLP